MYVPKPKMLAHVLFLSSSDDNRWAEFAAYLAVSKVDGLNTRRFKQEQGRPVLWCYTGMFQVILRVILVFDGPFLLG